MSTQRYSKDSLSRFLSVLNEVHTKGGRAMLQNVMNHKVKSTQPVVASLVAATCFTGYFCYQIVNTKQSKICVDMVDVKKQTTEGCTNNDEECTKLTEQQAMLQAMIANAKSSTWRENLQNAATAQKNLILAISYEKDSKEGADFVKKVTKRKNEIEDKRKEVIEQRSNAKKNANYFFSYSNSFSSL